MGPVRAEWGRAEWAAGAEWGWGGVGNALTRLQALATRVGQVRPRGPSGAE